MIRQGKEAAKAEYLMAARERAEHYTRWLVQQLRKGPTQAFQLTRETTLVNAVPTGVISGRVHTDPTGYCNERAIPWRKLWSRDSETSSRTYVELRFKPFLP